MDIDALRQEFALRLAPAPRPVSGSDATRTVTIDIDIHHRPIRLCLRAKWEADVAAADLGAAILAAYESGIEQQYQYALHEARFREPDTGKAPAWLADADTDSAAAKVDELRDTLGAGPGATGTRHIKLEYFGPWLRECHIDEAWSTGRSAVDIMNEFSSAIQASPPPTTETDALKDTVAIAVEFHARAMATLEETRRKIENARAEASRKLF
jgi:hypothetical protein